MELVRDDEIRLHADTRSVGYLLFLSVFETILLRFAEFLTLILRLVLCIYFVFW